MIKVNWELIAKLKIFKDRAINWGVLINFFMLTCLSVDIKLSFVHIIALIILVFIIAYFDMKYILPVEQEYFFKRNPEWQRRND